MSIWERVMVTGGNGFLGTALTKELVSGGKARSLWPLGKQDGDLCHVPAVNELFARMRPTLVFHLAARVGGIGANRAAPADFFMDNMMMGLNVLEACRRHRAKLVLVGSVCGYPSHAQVPFRESDLWNGYPEPTNAPYGIAKKALVVGAQAMHAQHGLEAAVAFPTNLYGPGDSFDLERSHVIPAMVAKMLKAGEHGVKLWGDGTPTRDFLHVRDAARALVMLAEKVSVPEPINLGSGVEISMRDLALEISRAAGYRGPIEWDASRPNGQARRRLDVTRARDLGWAPSIALEDGLREVVGDVRRRLGLGS